jgi:hypothetical protein
MPRLWPKGQFPGETYGAALITPRADWFDAALEGLIDSGRVLENEQKELVACP